MKLIHRFSRWLAWIGIVLEKEGCGCHDYAAQMDRWGVDGCRQRREEILDRLEKKAPKLTPFKRDGGGRLLDRAIHNAEAKLPKSPPLPPARFPPILRRHLIYHVYADRHNEVWRANIRQLMRRWTVFTGRRIVAVALGPGAHDLATVQAEFGPAADGIEWLEFENKPTLRETWTLLALLRTVHTHDADAVFYAHTKGNTTKDSVEGSTFWRNAMYKHLLDDPAAIDRLLQAWPMVGACQMSAQTPAGRSVFPSGLRHGDWLFAGTFWWFRADEVFSRANWGNVPIDRYGAEAWPGGLFAREEVHSVYQPWPRDSLPRSSPYNPAEHSERIADD